MHDRQVMRGHGENAATEIEVHQRVQARHRVVLGVVRAGRRMVVRLVACVLVAVGCGGLPEPILPLARTPDGDFRASAPPPLAGSSELRLPKPETRTLENGLSVFVVSRKELPLVTLALTVRDAGTGSDLPDPGVALMTAIAIIDPPPPAP